MTSGTEHPTAGRAGRLLALLRPYAVPFLFTLLGIVVTHWLDSRNWTNQHREQLRDARHAEATKVFDSTIVMLSRITTSGNALSWGLQKGVSQDSVRNLVAHYSANVYAFETQAPRFESLIKVYFDNQTLYLFTEAIAAEEAEQDQTMEALKGPKGNPVDPTKLRALMAAIMYLSEHMARELAADSA